MQDSNITGRILWQSTD